MVFQSIYSIVNFLKILVLIISKDHPILPDFDFSEWVSCNRSRNRLVILIFPTSIRILRTFSEKRDSNVICKLFFPSTVTEIDQSVSHIWVYKSGSTGDEKAGYRLIKEDWKRGRRGVALTFRYFLFEVIYFFHHFPSLT